MDYFDVPMSVSGTLGGGASTTLTLSSSDGTQAYATKIWVATRAVNNFVVVRPIVSSTDAPTRDLYASQPIAYDSLPYAQGIAANSAGRELLLPPGSPATQVLLQSFSTGSLNYIISYSYTRPLNRMAGINKSSDYTVN